MYQNFISNILYVLYTLTIHTIHTNNIVIDHMSYKVGTFKIFLTLTLMEKQKIIYIIFI